MMAYVIVSLQAKIVDFSGAVAKVGQPGELYIKPIGNSKFLGYYKDEKSTSSAVKDGWIRTG